MGKEWDLNCASGADVRGEISFALWLHLPSFWSLLYLADRPISSNAILCDSELLNSSQQTCLQSSIPPLLPEGSVPSAGAAALLLTEEKVKDFTGSKTSVKLQGLIESHL